MKKLSQSRVRWLTHHAQLSAKRQSKSKYKVLSARRVEAGEDPGIAPSFRLRTKVMHLRPPANFSLEENYEGVMSFIWRFRNIAVKAKYRVRVRIDKIEYLCPAGALMLAAEVDRWRRLQGMKLIAYRIPDWSELVWAYLKQMGFFELLEVPIGSPVEADSPGDTPITFIPYFHGEAADGALAQQLANSLEKITGPLTSRPSMFVGLTEAMTNVIHHAYPEGSNSSVDNIENAWWMGGAYDCETRTLNVMFFDQGIGIPNSLPNSKISELVRAFLERQKLSVNHDGNKIKAAAEVGRSAVGQPNRGMGLYNMRHFVDESSEGMLRIVSGRGEYIYRSGGRDTTRSHQQPIGGTFIEWQIQLPE